MATDAEWVEIRCPRTGEPMFANLLSGECLWEAPMGATVKEATNNQWWELFDGSTGKNYYFNATTNKTVWKKPPGADILPLSKLQAKSGPTPKQNNGALPAKDEEAPEDPLKSASPEHYTEETTFATNTIDRNSINTKLPPVSPYAVKPNNLQLPKPNKRGKIPPPIASKPATIKRGTGNPLQSRGEETPGSATTELNHEDSHWRYAEHAPPLTSVRSTEPGGDIVPGRLTVKTGSRSIENLSNLDSDQENLLDLQPSTLNDKLKQNRNDARYQSFHDFSVPSKYGTEGTNKTLPGPEHGQPSTDLQRRHSANSGDASPAAGKDKKGFNKKAVTRSPTSPIPKLPKDKEFVRKNINRHRGMFKKVSIATMLAYSKDPIKKPIILTQDKEVRKNAVDYFKNLQEYMGDTKSGKNLKDRERFKKAVDLTYTGWQKQPFRDEFFMQVIKQTTCNNKPKSLEWGWRLISVYLYYFPPTTRFQGYLEGYLYKNKEVDLGQGASVTIYADYCYERLTKMVVRGAKHGQKKPNEDDIAHAMQLPFKKSIFGATLEEVMELQRDSHANHHIPWVLTLLADKVIECGGYTTEGIFRVPGDIDRVGTLKVSIDNGEHLKEFPTSDASVCASLLKEWLREMYDPVIPRDSYQPCLDNCEHAQYCSSIIKDLPDINRLVVTYVIRFLQSFIVEGVVSETKMTADNLAMVFAPNLLRCPSTDLQVAMDNSRWEMTFMRTLINNLDTSYMEGIV